MALNQRISRFQIAAASFVLLFLISGLYLVTKDLSTIISQQRKIMEQAAKTASLWITQRVPQGNSPRQNSQTLADSQLSEALFRAELDLVAVADLDVVDHRRNPPIIIATSHPRHRSGQSLELTSDLLEKLSKQQGGSSSLEWSGDEWKITAISPIEGSDRWSLVLHAPQGSFVWSLLAHLMNTILLCFGFLLLGSMFVSKSVLRKANSDRTNELTSAGPADKQDELLQTQLVTDPLTKVYNRGYFDYFVSSQHLRWISLEGCSMLVIDIDHFKQINDQLGHAVGDEVLVGFSQFLRGFFRKSDKVIRYGGDEFVVMLSGTKSSEAFRISQNLLQSLKAQPLSKGAPITVSIGVAEYIPGESGKSWFERADAALYNVKHSGKNSVQVLETSQLEVLH